MFQRSGVMSKMALVFALLVSIMALPGTLSAKDVPSNIEGEAEVLKFVTKWLDLSQKNENFDGVMKLYADEVDFYKLGRVKKEAVAADKKKYFDRWPNREHRFISLAVQSGVTDAESEVTVSFHYKIRNAKGVFKEDDANTVLRLQRAKEAFAIVSEKDGRLQNAQPLQSLKVATDRGAATSDKEIERFMECRIPFQPTKRFRALIQRGIIPPKPLYTFGGAPVFVPSGTVNFYGSRVLLVTAFDRDDPDVLYVLPGFGTVPPTYTVVAVVGRKDEVELSVPADERQWLTFEQDSNFWRNNGKLYQFPVQPLSPVTTVTCFDFEAKDRNQLGSQ